MIFELVLSHTLAASLSYAAQHATVCWTLNEHDLKLTRAPENEPSVTRQSTYSTSKTTPDSDIDPHLQ